MNTKPDRNFLAPFFSIPVATKARKQTDHRETEYAAYYVIDEDGQCDVDYPLLAEVRALVKNPPANLDRIVKYVRWDSGREEETNLFEK